MARHTGWTKEQLARTPRGRNFQTRAELINARAPASDAHIPSPTPSSVSSHASSLSPPPSHRLPNHEIKVAPIDRTSGAAETLDNIHSTEAVSQEPAVLQVAAPTTTVPRRHARVMTAQRPMIHSNWPIRISPSAREGSRTENEGLRPDEAEKSSGSTARLVITRSVAAANPRIRLTVGKNRRAEPDEETARNPDMEPEDSRRSFQVYPLPDGVEWSDRENYFTFEPEELEGEEIQWYNDGIDKGLWTPMTTYREAVIIGQKKRAGSEEETESEASVKDESPVPGPAGESGSGDELRQDLVAAVIEPPVRSPRGSYLINSPKLEVDGDLGEQNGAQLSTIRPPSSAQSGISMKAGVSELGSTGTNEATEIGELNNKRRRLSHSPLSEPYEDEPVADAKQSEKEAKELAQTEAKRAPRKKRKWLKKGQIDPDDEAAVARQRERHAMIDQALEDLDRQYEAVENESHVQLIEMLEELDRRQDLQLARLEARHKATCDELVFMANHDDRAHMEQWQFRILAIQDEVAAEVESKIRLVDAEKNMFKRQASDYTLPRSGLGGGGWMTYDKHILSKRTLPLVQTFLDGKVRTRTDISVRPCMLDPPGIAKDLAFYNVRQPKPRMGATEEPVAANCGASAARTTISASAAEMRPPRVPDSGLAQYPAGANSSQSALNRHKAVPQSTSAHFPPPTQNRDTLPRSSAPRSIPSSIFDKPPRDDYGRASLVGQTKSSDPSVHYTIAPTGNRSLNSTGANGYMRPPAIPNPVPFSHSATAASVGGDFRGGPPSIPNPPWAPPEERAFNPAPNPHNNSFFRPSSSNGSSSHNHTNSNGNSADRQPEHAPIGGRWGFPIQSSSQSSSGQDQGRTTSTFPTRELPSFGSSAPFGRTAYKTGSLAPPPPAHPLPPGGPKSSTVIAGWQGDRFGIRGPFHTQPVPPTVSPATKPGPSTSPSSAPPPIIPRETEYDVLKGPTTDKVDEGFQPWDRFGIRGPFKTQPAPPTISPATKPGPSTSPSSAPPPIIPRETEYDVLKGPTTDKVDETRPHWGGEPAAPLNRAGIAPYPKAGAVQ